jgi:hypothetical protein
MPAGLPQTDQTKGHEARVLDRLAGLGGGGRTGSPRGDGRYGLLLLVLIGTYLFSAFNGRHLTTEVQIGLFAVILLLAMRSSPLPGRWPLIISTATVAGSAAALGAALTGTQVGEGAAELWKALVLLQTFQYFSFTTLTTLGYGDFTAAGNGGRSIAVMEALTGQVFLATLVARLVSAYRSPVPRARGGPSGRRRLPEDRGRLPEDVDGPGDDEDGD